MKDFYQQAETAIKAAELGKLPKDKYVAFRAAIERLQDRAYEMGQADSNARANAMISDIGDRSPDDFGGEFFRCCYELEEHVEPVGPRFPTLFSALTYALQLPRKPDAEEEFDGVTAGSIHVYREDDRGRAQFVRPVLMLPLNPSADAIAASAEHYNGRALIGSQNPD